METDDFLDEITEFGGGTPPSTGEFIKRRRKAKRNLQRILILFSTLRNWSWMQSSTDTAFTTGSDLTLDSTFLRFQRNGGLFVFPSGATNAVPVVPVPLHKINYLRQTSTTRGRPQGYCVVNSVSGATVTRVARLWPLPDMAYTGHQDFHRIAPRAVDSRDTDDVSPYGPITTDGPIDELPLIPDNWVRSAIYEGTLFLQTRDNANIQDNAIKAMLMEYVKDIISAEGPTGPTRLVPYGVARRYR